MSDFAKRSVGALLLAGLIGGAVYFSWPNRTRDPEPLPPAPKEEPLAAALPPFSESHFTNLGPEARFIGTAACAGCHKDRHESYLHTAHSKALSDVDLSTEPPDGSFEHKLSNRTFRVYRKDGQFRHEEVLRTPEGKEIGRIDEPVRYLVGSGHFSRTYLVDSGGFLHESPITWYASKKKWDMSPGYDVANHPGFERSTMLTCLHCHSGKLEETGENKQWLGFTEKPIGCESCHGAGSVHRDYQMGRKPSGQEDRTIVNPKRLSRPLLESICASCHMNGLAAIPVQGRKHGDFRPGRPLTDYQINYWYDGGRDEMTVVGHVEQLRMSRCYQNSELTCVTCHDPHVKEKPSDTAAYFRQKCLDCHGKKPCTVSEPERIKKNADNCAACHMPKGDTDIPHIAFSHHRIGKHDPKVRPEPSTRPGVLVPLDENPRLDEPNRRRNLGLAYVLLLQLHPAAAVHARTYHDRARDNLLAAYKSNIRDGDTLASLMQVYDKQGDRLNAIDYARQALASNDLNAEARAALNQYLGRATFLASDAAGTASYLEKAVQLRHYAEDWQLLGAAQLELDQNERASTAFRKALSIRMDQHLTYRGLAECFRRMGDNARANEMLEKADWVQKQVK